MQRDEEGKRERGEDVQKYDRLDRNLLDLTRLGVDSRSCLVRGNPTEWKRRPISSINIPSQVEREEKGGFENLPFPVRGNPT